MKSIGRRSFFRDLLTGGALAGVAAAQNTQPASQNAGNSTSSRRMDEMTSREIEFYLKSGDMALIPFGPVSGHGALIPVGMHAHWAHALSLLIAERANGLVFPVTHCCFAGVVRTRSREAARGAARHR